MKRNALSSLAALCCCLALTYSDATADSATPLLATAAASLSASSTSSSNLQDVDEDQLQWFLNTTIGTAHERRQQRCARKLQSSTGPSVIDAATIPKYQTELFIAPVLHDDQNVDNCNLQIAVRQFHQQMLPPGYPKTLVWGLGDPTDSNSFHHPSGNIEVTQHKKTYITWRNELVEDPIACRTNGFSPDNAGCNYVKHLLQDKNGVPIVDTTLHWAAPDRKCADGSGKTDCYGPHEPYVYDGPIPMVPHVHGAHVESLSDGYPESWFLPKANNIPDGYATEGTYFRSRYLGSEHVPDDGYSYHTRPGDGDTFFQAAAEKAKGEGYAVYRYTNDQETTMLWYHDHTIGITRLNVYAAGAGLWIIRTQDDGELRLAPTDCNGNVQSLPGPPAIYGYPPTDSEVVKQGIREIPLVIQDKDFYEDGRLFYPANRVYFDYPDCNDGTEFASAGDSGIPYAPNSDISPIWNPEAFFATILVNGDTFPKLTVAPERYRFRLVNACDSRTLNLALKIGSINSTLELPFFVIGSDQGMLPQVVRLYTGFATKITPGEAIDKETPLSHRDHAMLMGASERYDTIVDFDGLEDGTEVFMINTAPDSPFGGFGGADYEPANPETSGQVMKFIVDHSLRKGEYDTSTSPYDLIISKDSVYEPAPTKTRDLSVFEFVSKKVCVDVPPNSTDPCDIPQVNCRTGIIDQLTGFSSLTYGPTHANLGINGRFGPGKLISRRWMDPITQNPALGTTEIWEFWNWTGDAHPLHVHLVAFKILGRYDMMGNKLSGPMPYETGKKDTVLSLPGEVTKIQLTFDIAGYFVWHCHILSHEDNEMMLPFCVGRPGVDCPSGLF